MQLLATPSSAVNEASDKTSKELRRDDVHDKAQDRQADLALVRQVQAGDQQAFRALFDCYHRRAFAVAHGVLKNPQEAMDVVQESFLKVFRHIDKFQGNSSFYTWLYRIVMNLAIDQLRRQKKVVDREVDDRTHMEAQSGVQGDALLRQAAQANPRRAALRHELAGRIQRALDTLPEHHQAVIVLREIEGMSYEEIAEVLEVPKGTVMSRLFHARRKMQEELSEYLVGELEIDD